MADNTRSSVTAAPAAPMKNQGGWSLSGGRAISFLASLSLPKTGSLGASARASIISLFVNLATRKVSTQYVPIFS